MSARNALSAVQNCDGERLQETAARNQIRENMERTAKRREERAQRRAELAAEVVDELLRRSTPTEPTDLSHRKHIVRSLGRHHEDQLAARVDVDHVEEGEPFAAAIRQHEQIDRDPISELLGSFMKMPRSTKLRRSKLVADGADQPLGGLDGLPANTSKT